MYRIRYFSVLNGLFRFSFPDAALSSPDVGQVVFSSGEESRNRTDQRRKKQ